LARRTCSRRSAARQPITRRRISARGVTTGRVYHARSSTRPSRATVLDGRRSSLVPSLRGIPWRNRGRDASADRWVGCPARGSQRAFILIRLRRVAYTIGGSAAAS
jgi:hypothetical protein